jgi:hypothetical protein
MAMWDDQNNYMWILYGKTRMVGLFWRILDLLNEGSDYTHLQGDATFLSWF